MAKEFSADHLINVEETTSEERIQIVKDLTHGRGADVVIDVRGIPTALVEGLEMLGNGGVLLERGICGHGTVPISPHRHILARTSASWEWQGNRLRLLPALRLMERYGQWVPLQ